MADDSSCHQDILDNPKCRQSHLGAISVEDESELRDLSQGKVLRTFGS